MQKNPHIDRVVDFVAKFSTSLSNLNKTVVNSQETYQQQSQKADASADTTSTADKTQVDETISNQSRSQCGESTLMDYEDEEDNLLLTTFIEYLIEVCFFKLL